MQKDMIWQKQKTQVKVLLRMNFLTFLSAKGFTGRNIRGGVEL